MTVRELIEALERQDPDANVLLGVQPSWPFEHSVMGVTVRREFSEVEVDEDRDPYSIAGRPNDVIICEGGQVRYGDRNMFNCCASW